MTSTNYNAALALAIEIHGEQIRKGTQLTQKHPTPYISHLVAVSVLALRYGGEEEHAIAGLLHDALEDGGEEWAVRIEPFGERVMRIVRDCTDGVPDADGEKEPWNGEFYVSYGGDLARVWDEARQHGFISAGGGTWYSQTLKLLSPGDRVWVKIPKTGYVGVGRVTEAVQAAQDFTLPTSDGLRTALDVLQHGAKWRAVADDPEKSEYFVRVQWLQTVPESQAFNEVGLFGNQNSVCQPTTPKWRHTVERLKAAFPKWAG